MASPIWGLISILFLSFVLQVNAVNYNVINQDLQQLGASWQCSGGFSWEFNFASVDPQATGDATVSLALFGDFNDPNSESFSLSCEGYNFGPFLDGNTGDDIWSDMNGDVGYQCGPTNYATSFISLSNLLPIIADGVITCQISVGSDVNCFCGQTLVQLNFDYPASHAVYQVINADLQQMGMQCSDGVDEDFLFQYYPVNPNINGDAKVYISVFGDFDASDEYVHLVCENVDFGYFMDHDANNDVWTGSDYGNQCATIYSASATIPRTVVMPLIADGVINCAVQVGPDVNCFCGATTVNIVFDYPVETANRDIVNVDLQQNGFDCTGNSFTFSANVNPYPNGDATVTLSLYGDLDSSSEYVYINCEGYDFGYALDNYSGNDQWNFPGDAGNQCESLVTGTATVSMRDIMQLAQDGVIQCTFNMANSIDCFCGQTIARLNFQYPVYMANYNVVNEDLQNNGMTCSSGEPQTLTYSYVVTNPYPHGDSTVSLTVFGDFNDPNLEYIDVNCEGYSFGPFQNGIPNDDSWNNGPDSGNECSYPTSGTAIISKSTLESLVQDHVLSCSVTLGSDVNCFCGRTDLQLNFQYPLCFDGLNPPQLQGCDISRTLHTDPNVCCASIPFVVPQATDPDSNCGIRTTPSLYAGLPTGTCAGLGPLTIGYETFDSYGNRGACQWTYNIVDGQEPTISNCPNSEVLLLAAAGTCQAQATYSPSATDNCGSVTSTLSHPSGSLFNVGVTTVTYRATDSSGLFSDCRFDVRVVDNQDPVITCPGPITVAANRECLGIATFAPTATDNCGVSSIISNPASGFTFPLGVNTVTSTAIDNSGRSATCSFTVTVIDSSGFCGCGNGRVDPGEQCEVNQLGSATCQSLGFADGGDLGCSSSCRYDTSRCAVCGDGRVDGAEQCDNTNLNSQTCVTRGFSAGTLSCTNCRFNTASCSTCGNSVIEPAGGEQCEGSNLNGKSCTTEVGPSALGTLTCNSQCHFDTSRCNSASGSVPTVTQPDGSKVLSQALGILVQANGFTGDRKVTVTLSDGRNSKVYAGINLSLPAGTLSATFQAPAPLAPSSNWRVTVKGETTQVVATSVVFTVRSV